MSPFTFFDFSEQEDWSQWNIQNDTVMGGRSSSRFLRNDADNAVFRGKVSLENNGGFSSVQYQFQEKDVKDYSNVLLRLKGDGKRYQFRVKKELSDRHSYIHNFETSGKWQTITIPLEEMVPRYRGRALDRPNFNADQIEEVRFFIGNKKAQDFALEIDKIMLK